MVDQTTIVMQLLVLAAAILGGSAEAAGGTLRIFVLYDNTAHHPDCHADWGFSCLIEGTEKTILFDTGARGEILNANARALHVDLSRIDAIVISHPHLDHSGGLLTVLRTKTGLPVLVPFGSPSSLSETARSAGASIVTLEAPAPLGRDALVTGPAGGRIPEQALVIRRSQGIVVVAGCSHPGIVSIVEKAKELTGEKVLAVLGGFHLMSHTRQQVDGIVARFRALGVQRVGACHCTGEEAIDAFRKAYGTAFIEMGAGRLVELP